MKRVNMNRNCGLLVLLLFTLFITGCASSAQLVMKAQLPPVDDSFVSGKLDTASSSKIMIVPPSGTARGTFELQLALFEKEFLRQGMTVISPAVTGRIVMNSPDASKTKNEPAIMLSDMERALVMAKETGADVILQVGKLSWTENWDTRYFIASGRGRRAKFEEVGREKAQEWKGPSLTFQSPVLRFIGKVVKVDNAEILATLDVIMPANYNLPKDYVANYSLVRRRANLIPNSEKNFRYSILQGRVVKGVLQRTLIFPWFTESEHLTNKRLVTYVAEKISSAAAKKP